MSLLKFIKTNPLSTKIFGKKELEIIQKQLLGISLSQSEKNRLSRDIRPKFRFIKEAIPFQEEFELKKDTEAIMIVEKARNAILLDPLHREVEAILLFGSHVKKEVSPVSDIDICVVLTGDVSREDSFKFRMRVLGELPEKADVQVFNVLPQKIKRDIARKHRLLYKKTGFDDLDFTLHHLKDEDFFLRKERIFGEAA